MASECIVRLPVSLKCSRMVLVRHWTFGTVFHTSIHCLAGKCCAWVENIPLPSINVRDQISDEEHFEISGSKGHL